MTVLKIARMGQPVLRRRAAPVDLPRGPEVRRLAADMIETMHDAGGTGLAAPQVFVSRRLIVFFVDGARARAGDPEAEGVPLTVLVNPDYRPLDDEMESDWEGCLSIPGLIGQVPRHRRIRYWGETLDGVPVVREAQGFHARVVQHEIDHLDGILYPQRMTDLATLAFASELRAPSKAEAEEAEAERAEAGVAAAEIRETA